MQDDNSYRFDLVYLFNSILTPYGLFNAKIWFIYKCLIIINKEKKRNRIEKKRESNKKEWEKQRRKRRRRREREWGRERIKGLVWFICLMTYQLFLGYLMLKFASFLNIWLQLLLYFQCSIAFFFVCKHVLAGWLVGFYSISTLVGCLMQNAIYTYVLNVCDL